MFYNVLSFSFLLTSPLVSSRLSFVSFVPQSCVVVALTPAHFVPRSLAPAVCGTVG